MKGGEKKTKGGGTRPVGKNGENGEERKL